MDSKFSRRLWLVAVLAAVSVAARAQVEVDTLAVDPMQPVAGPPAARPPKPAFGYVSYSTALRAMRGYAEAEARLDTLKARYAAEAKRAADEFNSQYEEFLDGQSGYPESILRKRQSELQELLKRNVDFRAETARLLSSAREEIFAPLHRRLNRAISTVGRQQGLAFIINIDDNACPFIDSTQGENVTLMVIDMLK